jgi:hypothetical protein
MTPPPPSKVGTTPTEELEVGIPAHTLVKGGLAEVQPRTEGIGPHLGVDL